MSHYTCAWVGGALLRVPALLIYSIYSCIFYYLHMNKNYFAPGANYYDNHKEVTINNPGANSVDLLRAALAEDVEPVVEEGELFKYIHPSVTSLEEKQQISKEVQNLVRALPLSEICRYLRQMYKDKRVYLNVRTEAMFDELHRMGMPDETNQGFSQKNFQNYFNISD